MATLTAIRDAVNARLATAWPRIKTLQENYRSTHGVYFQGLLWSSTPDDGATVAPDLTKAPGDRFTPVRATYDAKGVELTPASKTPHSWAFFGLNGDLPAQIEMAVRMDVYEAPGGVHGYSCTCLVTKAGTTYARTAQVEDGVEITTGTWEAI